MPACDTRYGQRKGESMSQIAKGTFEVKLPDLATKVEGMGAKEIRKTFSGDMQGASHGQMLMIMGSEKGSAGYVAMEWFTGKLAGKQGRFALSHKGVMDRGATSLSVNIVPDTGTVELTGITGSMRIDIKDGTHLYVLEYELPGM